MAEKRGKESSDEDSGGEKGSPRRDEDEKGPTPDGSSGDDDYRQVRSKRQKLKEKKKRQKAKKAEDALRSSPLLLPAELERERLWALDSLKPSPEAIDQALAGHPATHPLLSQLLVTADTLSLSYAQDCPDLPVRPVIRRLVLSPSPLTALALTTAVTDHLNI
jgi:hypothetical protein